MSKEWVVGLFQPFIFRKEKNKLPFCFRFVFPQKKTPIQGFDGRLVILRWPQGVELRSETGREECNERCILMKKWLTVSNWAESCRRILEDYVELASGLYQWKGKELRDLLNNSHLHSSWLFPLGTTCPSIFKKIFSNFSPSSHWLFFSKRLAPSHDKP